MEITTAKAIGAFVFAALIGVAACGGDSDTTRQTQMQENAEQAPQTGSTAGGMTAGTGDADLVQYRNDRFNFTVDYPSGQLAPEGPPQNNDGRVFIGADGSQLRVFGSNNALDQSWDEQVAAERGHFADTTTIRRTGNSWMAEGTNTDGQWMATHLVRTDSGQLVTAEFTAPADSGSRTRNLGRASVLSLTVE